MMFWHVFMSRASIRESVNIFSSCSCRNEPSLTDILVVNGYKDVNHSFDSEQPQTEDDQQLEEDVAVGPHVGNKQSDFLPETLPG